MSENTDTPTDSLPSTELSESERHGLLAADRRRLVLDILARMKAPVELEDLAKGVATREEGSPSVGEEIIDRVVIALHHTHLPKLAEAAVIDYDPESHRIVANDVTYQATRNVQTGRLNLQLLY